jgi:hypothetical protein
VAISLLDKKKSLGALLFIAVIFLFSQAFTDDMDHCK